PGVSRVRVRAVHQVPHVLPGVLIQRGSDGGTNGRQKLAEVALVNPSSNDYRLPPRFASVAVLLAVKREHIRFPAISQRSETFGEWSSGIFRLVQELVIEQQHRVVAVQQRPFEVEAQWTFAVPI